MIVSFNTVPQLLARFGYELEDMSIGVGGEHYCAHGFYFFGVGPPADGVDGCLQVAFPVLDVGVELRDLAGLDHVVDAHEAIAMAAGYQRVLVSEFGQHDFALLPDGALHAELLLEGDLLDESEWGMRYSASCSPFYMDIKILKL